MPEHRLHVRQRRLDQPDAFDRLDRAADVILVAGGAGEHQRVEEDVLGRNAVFLGQQPKLRSATASLRSRVNAWACSGSSSMQPTTSAAP